MPHNNYFGQYYPTYQPMNMQANYQPQIQPQQQPVTDDRIFVQGEVGAKAYLIAPNATVTLWDSEAQVIYIKSNLNGIPSMQRLTYSYAEAPKAPDPVNMGDYVTRQEFEKRISELMHKEEDHVE